MDEVRNRKLKWFEHMKGSSKCTPLGHGNMDEEYKMGDVVLGRTTKEKDLGVNLVLT